MLNIHKFQSGYELFTTLCIVGDSDLAGVYEYLTSSRGSYCKNESIVVVISGNWEYETGLFAHYANSSLKYLSVPKCNTVSYGHRAFSVASTKLWNSLPYYLRFTENISTFKTSLKAFLSRRTFNLH